LNAACGRTAPGKRVPKFEIIASNLSHEQEARLKEASAS
jgi:hypothetical protein